MNNAPSDGRLSDKLEGRLKQRVQAVILCGGILLLLGKFYAFYITNSVAILTDAVESIVNVVAAVVSLAALVLAAIPKDRNHPFGHGKFEFLSASFEGLMIVFAGAYIIYEGVYRLFYPVEIQKIDVGIAVIAVAGVINYIMGAYSIYMGRKHDSIALISGGKHLHSDSYSTLGMVIGLAILHFTEIAWIDSAVALVFGALILITGLGILRRTIANLTDEADPKILRKIQKILASNRSPEWIDVHNLKITKYGGSYYIDCDLTLPLFYTISEGHAAYKRFKALLQREISSSTSYSVHFDSCEIKYCRNCMMEGCPVRKEAFEKLNPITIKGITAVLRHT